MNRFLQLLMACAVAATPLPAFGQAAGAAREATPDLPSAPESRVLDHAELFKRQPERMKEISDRLVAFEKKHDLPVYLAVYSGLMRGNVTQRAGELYDAWIGPERDGIVVVCDTDTRQVDLGLPGQRRNPGGEGAEGVSRLPDYQMLPILAELRGALRDIPDRVDYLDELTKILTGRVGELLSAQAPAGRWIQKLVFALVMVVVVTAAAAIGFVLNRRLRRADTKAREKFYFPDVLVGERLGAPFGGGKISRVEFGRPQAGGAE